MKITPVLLAALFAPLAARAAITITVSPGVSGTRFSVTQTAENPLVVLDVFTGGSIWALSLAPGSFNQNPAVLGYTGSFPVSLGTLANVTTGASSLADGFMFFTDADSGLHYPGLLLQSTLYFASNQSNRLAFTSAGESEIALDFGNFVPGTYLRNNVIFGQITTIVVPEPATAVLGLLATPLLFRRRR